MNFDALEKIEKNPQTSFLGGKEIIKKEIEQLAQIFLGEEKRFIDENFLKKVIEETQDEFFSNKKEGNKEKIIITYEGHNNKGFYLENKVKISKGEIINALRLGFEINLVHEERKSLSFEEIKMNEMINKVKIKKILHEKLNFKLATNLAEKEKRGDLLKSQAYKKIAERSGIESKQNGVFAEQMIIGIMEKFAIDRPDLKLNILEANAYQDVNNKIDFIISAKQKKGVAINKNEVEFDEKSIGVQFTTNIKKAEHKKDQIATAMGNASERGIKVDEIIYVELDDRVLSEALKKWEKSGKPVSGPWEFLPVEIRKQVIENLLKGVWGKDNPEEEKKNIESITKNIK